MKCAYVVCPCSVVQHLNTLDQPNSYSNILTKQHEHTRNSSFLYSELHMLKWNVLAGYRNDTVMSMLSLVYY